MDSLNEPGGAPSQRLVLTSPSIEASEGLIERQQNPRPVPQEPGSARQTQRAHWRYRDPSKIKYKAKELTRDERFEIRVLKKYYPHLTYLELSKWTGFTYSQVQRALSGPLEPKKKGGHTYKEMKPHEVQALLAFLYSDESHRHIPWPNLRCLVPEISHYGDVVIERTLRGLGFERKALGCSKQQGGDLKTLAERRSSLSARTSFE